MSERGRQSAAIAGRHDADLATAGVRWGAGDLRGPSAEAAGQAYVNGLPPALAWACRGRCEATGTHPAERLPARSCRRSA